ncbi:MAG: NADP-dependent oxidoreductase [Chloroflexi bacterium]|nr:NADP-dependent oxidoreductase [Chloroflexota bacterium]
MPVTSREVHLIARPSGMPREEEFAVVEQVVPDAGEGQVQVQNLYLSIDPAMRPRLSGSQRLNEPIGGTAIGRVVQSRHAAFREGALVQHRFSFREYFVSGEDGISRLQADPALPLTVYLHALGLSGFVAYGGLLEIGRMKQGEQVFVSTAAGSVGSVAVQVAKILGCFVIGSTGSDEKCRWLRDDLGIDAAINYKKEPIREALKERAANGIDVYFDNVGGDHLDAALLRMNELGRIAVCGMISAYNDATDISALVTVLPAIIHRRVTVRGFVEADLLHLRERFLADMTRWLREDRLKYMETIYDGIEKAPAALIGMLNGANTGKTLVRIAGAAS